MSRIMHPPRAEHASLRTPLTRGEQRVLDILDSRLSPEWEFYVQPHLNGLRPDLVVLHPSAGVAVFEIKDWNLSKLQYRVMSTGSRVDLHATDPRGVVFSIQDPVSKLLLYQEEIASLYCPRLDARNGIAVITAGLVFTEASRSTVEALLAPLRARFPQIGAHPHYFPLAAMEDVEAERVGAIFPEYGRRSSKYMTTEVADDLRGWLREPDHSSEQRRSLELDEEQRKLVGTRSATGYRRIRGPAGTGKSLVIAARASELARDSKRVLIVTFNITLKNYLRDLAVRHGSGGSRALSSVDFLSFHWWCKRCCSEMGRQSEYRALWSLGGIVPSGEVEPTGDQTEVLNEGLADLVIKLFSESSNEHVPTRYDAVIVDEGQDFRLSWWNALRLALRPSGEMLLAADRSQDLYDTASAWTEDAMTGAGFRGPWNELKRCYRMPSALGPHLSRFVSDHMRTADLDLPTEFHSSQQLDLSEERTRLRWVQVATPELLPRASGDEVQQMLLRLTPSTAVSDLVVLAPTQALGAEAAAQIRGRYGIRVHHTFDPDERVSRKLKLAFFKGDARVKATTLHSFKGWESRHLIVLVDTLKRPGAAALLYTAMTRLRWHLDGSALTIVSSCPELREYGGTWPEYVQFQAE